MRANPELLRGGNLGWIKFFLLSVYATMYVRDHMRPAFHAALGLDVTAYDQRVFQVCNEICTQVFPVAIDIDNPKFHAGMERLRQLNDKMEAAKARGGVLGGIALAGLALQAGLTFAGLYLLPGKRQELPRDVLLAQAW